MNDIEIGDYVRTRNGEIGIFIEYRNDKFFCKIKIRNTYYTPPISTIVNHSKNIIDLIEVGDFVNGYRVLEMFKFQNDKYAFTTCKSDFKSICRIWSEEDIETILTKEQYSQNCYTVERR